MDLENGKLRMLARPASAGREDTEKPSRLRAFAVKLIPPPHEIRKVLYFVIFGSEEHFLAGLGKI